MRTARTRRAKKVKTKPRPKSLDVTKVRKPRPKPKVNPLASLGLLLFAGTLPIFLVSPTARRRVEQMLERSPGFRTLRDAHGGGFVDFVSARLQVVEGDVERPRFGLGMDVLEGLRGGKVDALIHCAGLTDFSPDPARALRAQLAPARDPAAFSLTASPPPAAPAVRPSRANRDGDARCRVRAFLAGPAFGRR